MEYQYVGKAKETGWFDIKRLSIKYDKLPKDTQYCDLIVSKLKQTDPYGNHYSIRLATANDTYDLPDARQGFENALVSGKMIITDSERSRLSEAWKKHTAKVSMAEPKYKIFDVELLSKEMKEELLGVIGDRYKGCHL
jgi:hypothetical protein